MAADIGEHFAELRGRLDVIEAICALLISAHPRTDDIEEAINRLSALVALPQNTPAGAAHARGIGIGMLMIQAALATRESSPHASPISGDNAN